MAVEVRLLIPSDCAEYRALRLESLRLHPECFGANYQTQAASAELFFEGNIKRQDPQKLMLGAFIADELIGLCGLVPVPNGQVEISQMYVDARARGQGVSEQLLSAAKQTLQDKYQQRSLILSVFTDNYPAIACYRKSGFRDLKTIGAELFMVWEINQ